MTVMDINYQQNKGTRYLININKLLCITQIISNIRNKNTLFWLYFKENLKIMHCTSMREKGRGLPFRILP